jgi:hypothetical protein
MGVTTMPERLHIDRHDKGVILAWLEAHEDLIGKLPASEGRKGFFELADWVPLVVALIQGLVIVNDHVEGLQSLLEKAQRLLAWMRSAERPAPAPALGERILVMLFDAAREAKPVSIGRLSFVIGVTESDVRSEIDRLRAAGLVEDHGEDGLALRME